MKLVIAAVGKNPDKDMVQNWLYYYQKSKTTIPAALYYDTNVPQELFDYWPYETIKSTLDYNFRFEDSFLFDVTSFNSYLYLDTIKIYAYRDCGPSIIVDYDTIIRKQINISDLPDCEYGATPHHNFSNYFPNHNTINHNIVWLDEYDYLPWINSGVQIIRKDIFDNYKTILKKYLPRLHNDSCPECFAQTILSQVVRETRGVYLDPSWNWYYDSCYQNNDIIFEHYYGKEGKTDIKKHYKFNEN